MTDIDATPSRLVELASLTPLQTYEMNQVRYDVVLIE